MGWPARRGRIDPADRRRRLLAHSRYDQTPRQLVLEWTADGADYVAHADAAADDFARHWDRLRMVLEDAPGKLTREQLRAEWPRDFPRPSGPSLHRWLQRAVAAGLVCRDGTGRRTDPFVYWLPDAEARRRADNVLYDLMERQIDQLRQMPGGLAAAHRLMDADAAARHFDIPPADEGSTP
jgi:hypothetical protein